MRTSRTRLTGGAALLGVAALTAATLTAIPATADHRAGRPLADHHQNGTVKGAYQHLTKFEAIGDRYGNRGAGTPGDIASRDYIVKRLKRAGYDPVVQPFDFPFFQQTGPSTFAQTQPTQQTYVEDEDYALMVYSGSGDVTAPVEGVDLNLGGTSTSGCEPEDFANFTAGNIALIRRGACTFAQKATNAENAGAVGVIIFNTGTPGNTEAFQGTLGGPGFTVPIIGTSYAIGESLAADGTEVNLVTSTKSEIRETYNILAETKGDRQNVVMAGAHYDSILENNGMSDNGTGSAALLETAEATADRKRQPNNRIRFAWWGAEELGLLGAEYYVADMAENKPRKFQNIALYLNFDMVGSPNYKLGVYDGNNNAFPPESSADAPKGSGAIERAYVNFFDRYGTGSVPTEFSGRSDYGPFIALNVPSGGLFTGAEGIKTAEEAAMFGGTAGVAYDPNYHAPGDNIGNLSRAAMRANTAAIMFSVKKFARSTRSVNGDSTGHQPPPEPSPRKAARAFTADGQSAAR